MSVCLYWQDVWKITCLCILARCQEDYVSVYIGKMLMISEEPSKLEDAD